MTCDLQAPNRALKRADIGQEFGISDWNLRLAGTMVENIRVTLDTIVFKYFGLIRSPCRGMDNSKTAGNTAKRSEIWYFGH